VNRDQSANLWLRSARKTPPRKRDPWNVELIGNGLLRRPLSTSRSDIIRYPLLERCWVSKPSATRSKGCYFSANLSGFLLHDDLLFVTVEIASYHMEIAKSPVVWRGCTKSMLHEVMEAPTKKEAQKAAEAFVAAYGVKYPKATQCLSKDLDVLLTFYDFPAEHWRHIRSTNAIESSFSTVRLRQRVTKGAGNRTKALTMAFKLLEMAEARWRRINGYKLIPALLTGAQWEDGELITKQEDLTEKPVDHAA
jgi:hypothetical protein